MRKFHATVIASQSSKLKLRFWKGSRRDTRSSATLRAGKFQGVWGRKRQSTEMNFTCNYCGEEKAMQEAYCCRGGKWECQDCYDGRNVFLGRKISRQRVHQLVFGRHAKGFVDYRLVLARADGICYICGKPVAKAKRSWDHMIPISRGGTHTTENVALVHKRCNRWKADRTPAEIGI